MADSNAVEQLAGQVEGMSLDAIAQTYPNAHPEANPLDVWRAHLSNVLSKISGVDTSIIFPVIAWTQSLDKGDFIIPVPALRIKGEKPDALAVEWASKWPEDDPLFKKPVPTKTFLSFFIKGAPAVKTIIKAVREQGTEYGKAPFDGLKDPKDPSGARKRIIVEFSSPNVAKPFHAGHLRSTIIGGFLANLYEAAGWDVIRINYLGDWGKQYGLLALAFQLYGNEEELKRDPIDHLFKLYVRINAEMSTEKEAIEAQKKEGKDTTELEANSLDERARGYFKKMVDGDEAALAQWRHFRDLSIVKYKETYARLNIRFDEYSGESQVTEEDMAENAQIMADKGVTENDNGAVLIDFTKQVPGKEGKQLGKAVLRKRDGTALYLTRDVSELLGRFHKYAYDKMLYVVASQQELHLKQLFKITELIGHKDISQRCQHISFGMVQGMSTRKGTVKFLNDILRDVGEHMHEVMKRNEEKYSQIEDPVKVADILGISSVMVQDMTGKRINNYTFNMDAMTSFEGDTGPYLQYAHSRLCSIKRRAKLSDEEINSADLSLLTEEHAVNVARYLAQWPDVFQNTLKTLEPTTVLTYLFRMTHGVSSSYDHLQVVGSELEVMKARMALYDAARIVLYNGMTLLGLTPVER
ncbi:Arginine--tRNA ligase, cytoplasmic-like protein [Hapsidospora chrysogenum ATCC 11550]|uniref:arginine--tRNA ligase n=1 Tax=Hapsidospora chrysogenum (strain ATCC 11550 / CBS 779.69 / DSM 880 / IAM 14645 / JCM 23072 / IMI 49137) TaxID=857340 RepID=A0A086T228_HAPC1|nr:Arginine--tRNA ligase, cytoplasmic-like protein [Hapsidospora chrysogenum ATCC 11550]